MIQTEINDFMQEREPQSIKLLIGSLSLWRIMLKSPHQSFGEVSGGII